MRTPRHARRSVLPRCTSGSAAPGRHGRRAQSLVELALTLPVLFVLTAGVLDLAHVFSVAGICANAAREGARYGATNPTDTDGITTRVIEEAAGAPLTLTAGQVSVTTPAGTTSGNPITVQVSYQVALMLAPALGLAQPTIVRQTTMAIF